MKDTDRAKEYLSQIRKTERLIQRLQSIVQSLHSSLVSANCSMEFDKVNATKSKDTLSKKIAAMMDLETEINQYVYELEESKRSIYREIKKIPNLEQQNILFARYIQGMKWEAISAEVGHSMNWVYRTHKDGLISFLLLMDTF